MVELFHKCLDVNGVYFQHVMQYTYTLNSDFDVLCMLTASQDSLFSAVTKLQATGWTTTVVMCRSRGGSASEAICTDY